MCKCVEQFIAHMEKEEKAEPGSVSFLHQNLFDGRLLHRFAYREVGKKRTIKSYLTTQFCPVCGKRYDPPDSSRRSLTNTKG